MLDLQIINKQLFTSIFRSRRFKQFVFIVGVLFTILTAAISINPAPFLRFGYFGIFVFNLFGPGSLLIPSLARHFNIYFLALVSATGMAINDCISWFIGAYGNELIPRSSKVVRLEKGINRYGVYALFFWALIPFPYDLIGVIAGYLGISFTKFLIPTFLGRFLRFIFIGIGIIKIFGTIPLP